MKIRQYLAVALMVLLVAMTVKSPDTLVHPRVAMTALDRLFHPFGIDQPVYAQASGFKTWNNIQMLYVAADSTDGTAAGTGLQAMQGVAMGFPAQGATIWWWDCQGSYSQATGAVVDGLGISFSNAPTASNTMLTVAVTAATAPLADVSVSITGTSATQITPSFTPSALSTSYTFRMSGSASMPATTQDTIVQFYAKQATQGDAMTIKAGTVCMWHSVK